MLFFLVLSLGFVSFIRLIHSPDHSHMSWFHEHVLHDRWQTLICCFELTTYHILNSLVSVGRELDCSEAGRRVCVVSIAAMNWHD